MAHLMMKVQASDKQGYLSQSLLDVDDNHSLQPENHSLQPENGTPDDEGAGK